MEKAEATCPTELLTLLKLFFFSWNTRSCKWQQRPDKDNIEQHTADQTHTENGFSAALRLIGLDGEERGRPMGLPHGRLHVMWPQRRRCDSAGRKGNQSGQRKQGIQVGLTGNFYLDESLKSKFQAALGESFPRNSSHHQPKEYRPWCLLEFSHKYISEGRLQITESSKVFFITEKKSENQKGRSFEFGWIKRKILVYFHYMLYFP